MELEKPEEEQAEVEEGETGDLESQVKKIGDMWGTMKKEMSSIRKQIKQELDHEQEE